MRGRMRCGAVWTPPARRSRRPSARCRRRRLYIRPGPVLYTVLYTANDDRDRHALAPTHSLRLYTHNQVTAPRRGRPRFSNTVLETLFRPRFRSLLLSLLSSNLSTVDRFKEYNKYRPRRPRPRRCAERPTTSRNTDTVIHTTCSGCRQPT